MLASLDSLLASQQFILGPVVAALEDELSAWLGGVPVITCASGTDALLLALLALKIGHGDEVITSPFSFIATASVIALLGARPVFVDIDPVTFNLDPAALDAAITPRTRAILPVHLYGCPAVMDPILETARRHHLAVIEDAAQAIGAEYRGRQVGTLGKIGCFSFYPTKNLGAAGDGGMLTASDPELAHALRMLRVHGADQPYHHALLGINSRLDAMQAAILRLKLPHLAAWNEKRRQKARAYLDLFCARNLDRFLTVPQVPAECLPVWHQFVIRMPDRESVRQYLQSRGISTQVYYPIPLHLQPALARFGYRRGDFPQAELACREVLALPIYPELSQQHQEYIVDVICNFYDHSSS